MQTLLFLALFLTPAMARLGETKEQCIARYGPAIVDKIENGENYTIHDKAGFRLLVTYFEKKAALLLLSKIDKEHPEISAVEIQKILRSNNAGGDWKKDPTVLINSLWNADGKIAQYEVADHNLTLMTTAYQLKLAADKKAKEEENLDGF